MNFDQPSGQDSQISTLKHVFHDQLIACLEECAKGRRGLFSDYEPLHTNPPEERGSLSWPEAAQLRQLAFALQTILAQSDETGEQSDQTCDQFLDLCSIHGEADPGESKLARAFLAAIDSK